MSHRLARSSAYDDPALSHAPRGDVQAFNRLVGHHQAAAYNLAYRVLGDAEAAADVTQSAFLTVYRQRPLSSPAAFRSSVFQHIAAACSRRLRALPRPATEPQHGARRPARPARIPERDLDVQAGILTLPPEQRIVLVLADVCGLGYRDIAHTTGQPILVVSAHLSRARTTLAAYLHAHSGSWPDS